MIYKEERISSERIYEGKILNLRKDIVTTVSGKPASREMLSMREVIDRNLKVMDLTAATICMENNMKIQVFGLSEEESMVRAVCGEKIGTLIE